MERPKNLFLIGRGPEDWAVIEEATGVCLGEHTSYKEAEALGCSLARERRVQLIVPDFKGRIDRYDFRPWWMRWLFGNA
jgi:hypothetical protein